MADLTFKVESRPVYAIHGDYKVWRYFSLDAALRRLALRKLAKRYPIERHQNGEFGSGVMYISDLEWEDRIKIVKRFVRIWKPIARKAGTA